MPSELNGAASMPPAPAAPPRKVSSLAARRAWTEPAVRVWWLMALLIFAIVCIYAVDRVWSWHVQNQLINAGLPVSAKVTQAGGLTIVNENVPAASAVTLTFDWKGQPQTVNGFLEGREEYIMIGKTVPIRVDPDDPTVWTYRTRNTALIHELFVGLIVFPLVPLLAGLAMFRRYQLLQTVKRGEAVIAIVSERGQTPIAPLSHMIRCSLRDRGDRRIHVVYVPRGSPRLAKGDALWVFLPQTKSGRPIAAAWFE